MKKLSALALIALTMVGAACGQAQESLALLEPIGNQFEFLRGLRQKGYSAQANEYIDILLKSADPNTAALLNLEKARNGVAMAKEGKSLDEKTKLLDEARKLFEPFVKGGAKTAAAAQARTELAKLLSIQAQMTLNKALAADDKTVKEAGAKTSRALYDAADAEFKESVAVLTELAKTDKQYEADAVQAEFDRANNLIDKAQAYLNLEDGPELRARATTVDAAAKIFGPIAKKKDTAQGQMANAYLIKAYQQLQDPSKVNDLLVIAYEYGRKEKYAEPAFRLARYFEITWIPDNPNLKQKYPGIKLFELLVDSCKEWLKDYPAQRRTYLGEALRFEQAYWSAQIAFSMHDKLKADKLTKFDKKTQAEFDAFLGDAKKLAGELDKEKGDYAERGKWLENLIYEQELARNLNVANDSKALVRKANAEFNKAVAANEQERQKLLRAGLKLLEDAIALAIQEKLPASEIHKYEFQQGAVYAGINDYHRAAISFEALARAYPPSKKGAEAAGHAIRTYQILADKGGDKGARERLHDLADFVFKQKLWENDPVQGFAHYDLAMDYLTEQNYEEALKHLEALPKETPFYTFAQAQATQIALAGREAEESPEEKKAWTAAAKKALERMGPLPADADANTTLQWLRASNRGLEFYYFDGAELIKADKIREAEQQYLAMKKNVAEVAGTFAKYGNKLALENKDIVKLQIEVLEKYWRLGLADVEYRRGNYKNVISGELLGATLTKLVQTYQDKPTEPIKVKDVPVMVDSVNLSLRTFVQLGDLKAANLMYAIMLKLDSEKGGVNKTELTQSLVAELAKQVETLKGKKDSANLEKMVTKFSGFVDALADNLVNKNASPDMRDIKNLAKFYGSLGLYKKAADLFKKVPTPKFLEAKDLGKLDDKKNLELWNYWDMQVENGRLLRESKEYVESNKVLSKVVTHHNSRYQRLQLEAEVEQIRIYEDRESYGNAIKLWKNYMDNLQRSPKFKEEAELKKKYFDGYYSVVLCYYKYSQLKKTKEAGKEDAQLSLAANMIVRLESSQSREGWNMIGPKFQELLAKEKPLRDKYLALKKASTT